MRLCAFYLLLLSFFFGSSLLWAKVSESPVLSALPGEIQSLPSGEKISLEKNRSLLWPKTGPLELKDHDGKTLALIDLAGKKKKVSGAEAMGIEVEETDLGGSMGRKSYLTGKKKPSGRPFDADSLADKPTAQDSGQVKSNAVDGIQFTETTFPNGASQWLVQWPGVQEKIFWDRRRSMVSDEQSWHQNDIRITLTQWADGSYSRSFSKADGELMVSFDQNDGSYRFLFKNPAGEALAEVQCQESCSSAN